MLTNHAIQCFRDVFNIQGKPKERLHLECLKFNIHEMDSNFLWIGFESQFQKVKKTETREGYLNHFVEDSNHFQTRNSRSALRKKGYFCPCFGYFLASSISDKNEDMVQNL